MSAEDQILRDFLQAYNRIVEECFNRCIYTFNYRYLLDDEIDCTSRCTLKYANYNQRVTMNFADIQAKKIINAQEAAEAQQTSMTTNNQSNESSNPS